MVDGSTTFARARFSSALVLIALGTTLAVLALAFSPRTGHWLGLGIGAAAVGTVALAALVPGRGAMQRALDLPTLLLGAWTAVAALLFAGGAGKWLDFADGAGIAAAGLLGLLLHEWGLERDLAWAAEQILAVRRERADSRRSERARSERTRSEHPNGDGAHTADPNGDFTLLDRYTDALSRTTR